MDKCFFDRGGECLALEIKKCDGCKFYKDYLTFNREREKSQRILQQKNLKVKKKFSENNVIVSTEREKS